MLASICLAAALVIEAALILSLKNEVEELHNLVDSHWAATQHECNGIWEAINGEEE